MLYEDFLKTQKAFLPSQDVSRETFDRLNDYVNRVLTSNEQFNLLGSQEKNRIWDRHVFDSMQLFPYLNKGGSVCDVGSGSGFPGIVLGILGIKEMVLVESIAKKASFLEDVSRETSLENRIICDRIENLQKNFDFIVARAVAPLEKLFRWTRGMRDKKTTYVLLKGQRYLDEVRQAEKRYNFSLSVEQSVTHLDGKILIIRDVHDS